MEEKSASKYEDCGQINVFYNYSIFRILHCNKHSFFDANSITSLRNRPSSEVIR